MIHLTRFFMNIQSRKNNTQVNQNLKDIKNLSYSIKNITLVFLYSRSTLKQKKKKKKKKKQNNLTNLDKLSVDEEVLGKNLMHSLL